MEMQNVKDQAAKVFTPARLKKAVACAVLVGIVSAGGAYYHHRQAEARSLVQKQAQSEMIAVQASQRGMVLLDEEHVQTIAAEAMPVLRYRTGLQVRLARGRCACGSTQLLIIEE